MKYLKNERKEIKEIFENKRPYLNPFPPPPPKSTLNITATYKAMD